MGLHPHFLTQWAPSSPSTVHRLSNLSSSLTCTVGHTSSFYDAVGIYPLVYLHNGYHPRHLLYTDSPASFPPLFAKWAHTSTFMTQWAYTFSFTYTLCTTLAIYCSDCRASVPPLFAQWAHTSSFYDTVGLYPLIYLHNGHHPSHLLDTNRPVSVSPLPTQWAHTFSFYNLLTPLNLQTGIKGQIQFLQIISSL